MPTSSGRDNNVAGGGQYTSFMSQTQNQTLSTKPFGQISKRFDAKLDLKGYFNREPGPGTYTNSTAESSIMGVSTQSQST